MTELIYKLINVAYLTTGRRIFALKRCLVLAEEHLPELVPLIRAALEHDLQTVALERAWARSKKVSTARGAAKTIDAKIDGVIGALHSILQSNLTVLTPDNPIYRASQTIIGQLFPEGVHPIIVKPFEEQLAINETLVNRLENDLNAAVTTVGLGPHLNQLSALNDAFRHELQSPTEAKEITYDRVEAANDKGNLFIRRIVAVVLGTYHQDDEPTSDLRRNLLAPILEQVERIRKSRKGRRNPTDVNPETGEELGTEA